MADQSYKRQKQSSALPVPCLWPQDGGQPDEGQNEQQQQQPANHSSDNAEIARCLLSTLSKLLVESANGPQSALLFEAHSCSEVQSRNMSIHRSYLQN